MTVRPVLPVAKGVRLKSRNHGETHTSSIELSILKHPVITVVNKRRKEANYGQELAFQVNGQ